MTEIAKVTAGTSSRIDVDSTPVEVAQAAPSSATVTVPVEPELRAAPSKLTTAPGPQTLTLPAPAEARPARALSSQAVASPRFANSAAVMVFGAEQGADALRQRTATLVDDFMQQLRDRSVTSSALKAQLAELESVASALNVLGPSHYGTAQALVPLLSAEATSLMLSRQVVSKERLVGPGGLSEHTCQTTKLLAEQLFALAMRTPSPADVEPNQLRALAKDVVATLAHAAAVLPAEERGEVAHVTLPRMVSELAPDQVVRHDGQYGVGTQVLRPAQLTVERDPLGRSTLGLSEPLISKTGRTDLPVLSDAWRLALDKLGDAWFASAREKAVQQLDALIGQLP